MQNTPTITVKGTGNVTQAPDLTIVSFDMSGLDREYGRSVEMLNNRVEMLRKALTHIGVERTGVKTTHFSVGAAYEYIDGRREFQGWKAQHNLRLEFPVDRELLNRVLASVTYSDVESEISIHFEVKDEAALRERVLEDATRTARRNAEAIASAAGVRLGDVARIEYSWAEIHFQSMQYALTAEHIEAAAPDVEPEDVRASDTVSVVWTLVKG